MSPRGAGRSKKLAGQKRNQQDSLVVKAPSALPLVFFPGASGRVENLHPIGRLIAKRRATTFCVYPGLGGVAPKPDLRTLADLQRHLLASLPERFDLVTMSMGGVLALRIALEHPGRLRKMVLMATSGGVDVTALGGIDWRDSFRRAEPNVPDWFLEDRTDVTGELGRIAHPTLLIYGAADPIAPPGVGRLLCDRLTRARIEVIPSATHSLELEFPEVIADMIEAHLDLHVEITTGFD
jgi:pimeloyl-ACP methyl ester carboxylesterase